MLLLQDLMIRISSKFVASFSSDDDDKASEPQRHERKIETYKVILTSCNKLYYFLVFVTNFCQKFKYI